MQFPEFGYISCSNIEHMQKGNYTKYTGILLLFFSLALAGNVLWSQNTTPTKPKLVVGIVVDQMRFDYLYKFRDKYDEGGFNRIMREGFNFKNTQFNYTPTVTAAGHASIYTGTTPANHGIISNSWYDRKEKQVVSNVSDPSVTIVGSQIPDTIGLSPKNMLTTTLGDQLRLGTNFQSKVFSVSLKDRGAILPGGHTANAAFWHDWQTSPGYFVSSSYYMDQLPNWVAEFNTKNKCDAYLDTSWETLYPIVKYTESTRDDTNYERIIGGKPRPTFPYDFKELRERFREIGAEYQLIWASPAGNILLTEFAMEVIKNEELGRDSIPDLISISYSTPDVIGHTFGPNSVEMEDIYLRLDRNIATLLKYLDQSVGENNYVLFLTSDHGVMPVPSYLKDQKLPSGIAAVNILKTVLGNYLKREYGHADLIESFSNEQVYFNRQLVEEHKINMEEMQLKAANYLMRQPGVHRALTRAQLLGDHYTDGTASYVQKGFNPGRSGDVVIAFKPGYIQDLTPGMTVEKMKGTTHGSNYAYDTHVPMLWMGANIPIGESIRKVSVTDIAPSLAMFLNLQLPNGSTGDPLYELFE